MSTAMVDLIAGYVPVILILRRHGASLRTIAKATGIPKSTLGRYMPAIEHIAAEEFPELAASQMGHP